MARFCWLEPHWTYERWDLKYVERETPEQHTSARQTKPRIFPVMTKVQQHSGSFGTGQQKSFTMSLPAVMTQWWIVQYCTFVQPFAGSFHFTRNCTIILRHQQRTSLFCCRTARRNAKDKVRSVPFFCQVQEEPHEMKERHALAPRVPSCRYRKFEIRIKPLKSKRIKYDCTCRKLEVS